VGYVGIGRIRMQFRPFRSSAPEVLEYRIWRLGFGPRNDRLVDACMEDGQVPNPAWRPALRRKVVAGRILEPRKILPKERISSSVSDCCTLFHLGGGTGWHWREKAGGQ